MSKFAGLSGGTALGVGGAAVAAALGLALYFGGVIGPSEPEPAAPAALTEPQPTEPQPTEPQAETAAPEQPQAAASPEIAEDPAPAPAVAALPAPPSIDTFRLDGSGGLLISGRAAPGWTVDVLIDDASLAQIGADGAGQFADFLTLAPSDQPRVLSLRMTAPDGGDPIASTEQIIIAPTPPPAVAATTPEPAEPAEPETAAQAAAPQAEPAEGAAEASVSVPAETTATLTPSEPAEGAVEDTAPMTAPAEATAALAQAEPAEPAQTTIIKTDSTGVTILQAPEPASPAPEVMSVVALDAITYDEAGQVQLSGRGQGQGFVRVYLDNKPITTSRIAAGGNWRSDLPQVDTGVYTLRIDEVDATGQVTSRVETPFKREEEAVLAEAGALSQDKQVQVVTVQPGSTLWAISREAYGDGLLYVRVFEANSDRIRNPDLIYPGQVFTLPE